MTILIQNLAKFIETNQETLHFILDLIPLPIFIKNRDGQYLTCNTAFESTFGFTRNEMIGKTGYDLWTEPEASFILQKEKALFEEPGVINYEAEITTRQGELRFVQFQKTTFTDSKGNVAGLLAVLFDLTEKKAIKTKLVESESKYRLIAEHVSDVIWVANLKNNSFTYVSPSIFELSGYTAEEVMQLKMDDLLTSDSVQKMIRQLPKRLEDQKIGSEYYIDELQQPCKNGEVIWIEISSRFRLNDQKEIEVIGVARNIDQRKKMEQFLIENEQRLRELNETKNKMFSIISHDLRSPLTSLMSFFKLLEKQDCDKDNPEYQQFVSAGQEISKRTYGLLENLLNWSRSQLNAVSINKTHFNIQELIFENIELYQTQISAKEIHINVKLNSTQPVLADLDMIKTVLRNLIHNAIKFTPQKGEITITTQQLEAVMQVTVEDTGIGIAADRLSHLFNFSSSKSTIGTDGEKGTGLGLSLAYDFVIKNEGQMWVESEPEKGSQFHFTLPISETTISS